MGYVLQVGGKLPAYGNNILTNRNVVTVATNNVLGFSSSYGIALDIANNRYYVCNSGSNTVRVMNYTTNSEIAVVSGFSSPRFIALDIANNRYYVTSYSNNSVRIMNYTTNAEIAVISGFSSPIGIALDIANNRYYVTTQGTNAVRIDTYLYS